MKIFSPHEFLKKGYFHLPLLISNSLFICLFVVLALNQRLATDDFYFLANFQKYGVVQGTWEEYNTWSTRFFSVGLNQLVLFFQQHTTLSLTVFTLTSLIVFILVIQLNISNITRVLSNKNNKQPIFNSLNLSVFILSIIFITTIKIDETWFWLCSTCTYLWGVMMLLLGIAWLTTAKNNLWYAVCGTFGFMYLGGSSGPLALVVLLFLLSAFVYSSSFSHYLRVQKKSLQLKAALAFLLCFTAFLILYFGKGNQAREAFFQQISLLESILLNTKMTGIIVLKRLPTVLPLMVVLSFPLLYAGNLIKEKTKENGWKTALKTSFLYAIILYLYQLSITYKTQDVAAYRALFFVSTLTFVYIGKMYFVLGKNLPSTKLSAALFYISFLFSPTVFSYQLIKQSAIAFEYSNSYDARMDFLSQREQSSAKTTLLPPLKNSGMLYSAEISPDTSFHSNQHLKKALKLNGAVKVKTLIEQ